GGEPLDLAAFFFAITAPCYWSRQESTPASAEPDIALINRGVSPFEMFGTWAGGTGVPPVRNHACRGVQARRLYHQTFQTGTLPSIGEVLDDRRLLCRGQRQHPVQGLDGVLARFGVDGDPVDDFSLCEVVQDPAQVRGVDAEHGRAEALAIAED